MWACFETSARVKRYVDEAGRREVLRLLRQYQVATSAVVFVELRSAFRRRVAQRTLDEDQVPEILKRVAADRDFWALIEVNGTVLAAAETLVAARPLRTRTPSTSRRHGYSAPAYQNPRSSLSALTFGRRRPRRTQE